MDLKFYRQETNYTCGCASLRMALEYLGIRKTEKQLSKALKTNKVYGSCNRSFPRLAEKYKLSYAVKRNGTLRDLKYYLRKGCVIILGYYYSGWMTKTFGKVYHYAVLRKIGSGYIYLYDPWFGPNHRYDYERFKRCWRSNPKTEFGDKHWFIAIEK